MASQYPLRLREYCDYYGISFFDLTIRCIFCKCTLTVVDLAKFHAKVLSLAYRDDEPFAACTRCLRVTAYFERERYLLCTSKCSILDAVVGCSLDKLTVRCLVCLALLTEAEKAECAARDSEAHLIRGYWRTVCNNCRNEGQRSYYEGY